MYGVAVAGCGTVGSGVIRMLTENKLRISRAAGVEIVLKYAVDIRPVNLPEGVVMTDDFSRVLADPQISVVVETIGGVRVALDYTRRALEAGKHVVTSNKELVSSHGDELLEVAKAHGCRYLYEASVGGGVPVLRPLRLCLAGNRIDRVYGIVNGSTNYLLTSMEDRGLSFKEALAEARDLGYVEANPDADVLGWDARRKCAILAHTAFGSSFSDEKSIPTEGIARITPDDLALASAVGCAVKLIACAHLCDGGYSAWVRPALVQMGHPLYMVRDVFNGIVAVGDCVGDVMFYGRGAGSLPTASAVVGDLIELGRDAKGVDTDGKTRIPYVMDDPETHRYLIRTDGPVPAGCEAVKVKDVRGILTPQMTWKETALLADSMGAKGHCGPILAIL